MANEVDYDLDWEKVTSLEDVIEVLKACSLSFFEDPNNPNQAFDPVRHMLVKRPTQ